MTSSAVTHKGGVIQSSSVSVHSLQLIMSVLTLVLFSSVAGFITSMPSAGPASAFLLSKAIQGEKRFAWLLSAGAALSESAYAFVAHLFWGYGALAGDFSSYIVAGKAVSAVICLLMWYTISKDGGSAVAENLKKKNEGGKDENRVDSAPYVPFLLGMSLTGLNPALLASWSGVTAAGSTMELFAAGEDPLWFAVGAFVGIVGWYTLLIKLVDTYRHSLKPTDVQKGMTTVSYLMLGVAVLLMVQVGMAIFEDIEGVEDADGANTSIESME